MLHSVTNGALRGAIAGAVGGLLLWVVVKVFKLEGYLGGKKTPSATPTVPPLSPPSYEPTETNAWSGDRVYPPRPVLGDVPSPAPTQTVLIAVMWGLTALIFLAFVIAHITSVLLIFFDIPALIIAIILLFKRNAVNRWNGGAKLGLELIAFVVAFMASVRFFPGLSTPEPMPAMPMSSPLALPVPGKIVPPPNFAPPPVGPPNLPMPPQFSGPPMPSLPR